MGGAISAGTTIYFNLLLLRSFSLPGERLILKLEKRETLPVPGPVIAQRPEYCQLGDAAGERLKPAALGGWTARGSGDKFPKHRKQKVGGRGGRADTIGTESREETLKQVEGPSQTVSPDGTPPPNLIPGEPPPPKTSSLERRGPVPSHCASCHPLPSSPHAETQLLGLPSFFVFAVFVFSFKYKTKIHLVYHHRYIYFTLTT